MPNSSLSLSLCMSLYPIFILSLSPGSLHQSQREEERVSEHTKSGRPFERVLFHLLRHTLDILLF